MLFQLVEVGSDGLKTLRNLSFQNMILQWQAGCTFVTHRPRCGF